MSEIGTPNNIDVLLHCYYSPRVHPRIESKAVLEAIDFLGDCGAIIPTDELTQFKTTPKGTAWVKALCRVPEPTSVFIDRDGEVLK